MPATRTLDNAYRYASQFFSPILSARGSQVLAQTVNSFSQQTGAAHVPFSSVVTTGGQPVNQAAANADQSPNAMDAIGAAMGTLGANQVTGNLGSGSITSDTTLQGNAAAGDDPISKFGQRVLFYAIGIGLVLIGVVFVLTGSNAVNQVLDFALKTQAVGAAGRIGRGGKALTASVIPEKPNADPPALGGPEAPDDGGPSLPKNFFSDPPVLDHDNRPNSDIVSEPIFHSHGRTGRDGKLEPKDKARAQQIIERINAPGAEKKYALRDFLIGPQVNVEAGEVPAKNKFGGDAEPIDVSDVIDDLKKTAEKNEAAATAGKATTKAKPIPKDEQRRSFKAPSGAQGEIVIKKRRAKLDFGAWLGRSENAKPSQAGKLTRKI